MTSLNDEAIAYAERGWLIVPAKGKNPGAYLGDAWQDQATCDVDVVDAWWDRWPTANIGLLLGPASGVIDVEFDDARGAAKIADVLSRCSPESCYTPTYTSSRSEHRLFRFDSRLPEVNKKTIDGVEFRIGFGGGEQQALQSIVPPSVHPDGPLYQWRPGLSPDDVDLQPLPDELLWLLQEGLADRAPEARRVDGVLVVPPGSRHDWAMRKARLWADEGMTPEQIADLLETFFRSQPGGGDKSRSELLRQATWAVEKSEYDPQIDLSGITSRPPKPVVTIDRDAAPDDPGPLPGCLVDNAGGLMADVIAWNLEGAFRRQPELALAGAMSLVATITGHKVRTASNARTNLYVLGIAESGAGKDRARVCNQEILFAAGCEKRIGPESVGSHAGLAKTVWERGPVLLQLDEIGKMLETLRDTRRAPHLADVMGVLMKLYTSSGGIFVSSAVVESSKIYTIQQPHCVVYGTTVPQNFYGNLTADALQDGFASRLIVIESSVENPPACSPTKTPPPVAIVEQVREWEDYSPRDAGNLHGAANAVPDVVAATRDAAAIMDEFAARCEQLRNEARAEYRAIWNRAHERAVKLSLVHACSLHGPGRTAIDGCSAEWGCLLAEHVTRRFVRQAWEFTAENQTEGTAKRIAKIIRDAGQSGIRRTLLTRRTQWLTARQRSEVLSSLSDSGEVVASTVTDTGGRNATTYFATVHYSDD